MRKKSAEPKKPGKVQKSSKPQKITGAKSSVQLSNKQMGGIGLIILGIVLIGYAILTW